MEKYKSIISDGVTSQNFSDAAVFVALLKIISTAHPDEPSGKKAKETLVTLQSRCLTQRKALEEDLDKKNKPILDDMVKLEKEIRVFASNAHRKRDFLNEKKLVPETCIVEDNSREFDRDKEAIFFKVVVSEVVKVGTEDVLLKDIIHPSDEDLKNPEEALKKSADTRAEYKTLIDSAAQVDCKKAARVAAQYRAVLEKAQGTQGIRNQLFAINSILSNELY